MLYCNMIGKELSRCAGTSTRNTWLVCLFSVSKHQKVSSVSKSMISLNTQTSTTHLDSLMRISRPQSCSLTSVSVASNQIVTFITTVGGSLSECCSSSVTNTAILWISQSTTVYNCQKEKYHDEPKCSI